MKKKKRQYDNDYYSVTQVLSLLRKPQLEGWLKCNNAVDIDNMNREALEIGSIVHEGIENFVSYGKANVALGLYVTKNVIDSSKNAMNSFINFRKTFPQYDLTIVEHQMINHDHKINGTIDCIGTDANGDGVLLDWKTCSSKEGKELPIYLEAKLQVAAYASLYNLLSQDRSTKIKTALIVALAKDKEEYRVVELNEKEIKKLFDEIFIPLVHLKYALKENKEILDR